MARITVAGHSLHAIINDWPIGLFSTSLVFDSLSVATKNENLARAGYYSLVAGYVTAIGAAVTGVAEYRAVERTGPVKKLANRHTVVNMGLMAVMTGVLALRSRSRATVTPAPLALSVVGNALTILSAWLGDEMVYGHQVRVQDRGIKADDKDIRIPGDESIARVLRQLGTDDPTSPSVHTYKPATLEQSSISTEL